MTIDISTEQINCGIHGGDYLSIEAAILDRWIRQDNGETLAWLCPKCAKSIKDDEDQRLTHPEWCVPEHCEGYDPADFTVTHRRIWTDTDDIDVVFLRQVVEQSGFIHDFEIGIEAVDGLSPEDCRAIGHALVEVSGLVQLNRIWSERT